MDQERVNNLKKRRQQLQKHAEYMQLKSRVASQIAHSESLGEGWKICYESENLSWISSNVQIRKRDGYNGVHSDFQIDVDDNAFIEKIQMREAEFKSAKFRNLILTFFNEQQSLIVCYQGGDPELEISVKSFLDQPQTYLSRPETWVLTSDRQWIIEYIWEQGVIRFIYLNDSSLELCPKLLIKVNQQ